MNICDNILRYRCFHTCSRLYAEKPHKLKGKKPSSQQWLMRYIRDPYVEKAKQENYRCRSAFKLLEINERFGILKPGMTVVDCGAAPGSWTQVAVKMTNADGKTLDEMKRGIVVGIDRLPIHPVEGALTMGNLDFTTKEAQDKLSSALNGKMVDLVMSDMAPNATGCGEMDHEKIVDLCYSVMRFALQVTRVNGNLLMKLWDGNLSPQLEKDLERFYQTVKNVRPDATRDESTEKFLLARGFKGLKKS